MRPETKALYPKNWTEIAHRVRVERHYTCEGCGQKGNRPLNPLTVHHIDYNPKNNADGNLLLLCAKCHLRLQQGTVPSLLLERRGQLRLLKPYCFTPELRAGH
jgi:hypothetical protein